jgi:hypothetical protein
MKSNQKSSQQKCFFALPALCAANQSEPGLQTIALLRTRNPSLLQIFAMPSQRSQATIVLPDFIRSCSADGFV